MGRITTKTGDRGHTSLFGGKRVAKDSKFIGLLGDLDELQAAAALARHGGPPPLRGRKAGGASGPGTESVAGLCEILFRIEDDLYRIMAMVGFEMKCPETIKAITEEDVEFLEKEMGRYEETFAGLTEFIRPGTTDKAARLNMARAVCRRVERGFVAFAEEDDERSTSAQNSCSLIIKYLNRLSDLLFVLTYVSEER
jgi:cob(I)alamin adenosyltransferase